MKMQKIEFWKFLYKCKISNMKDIRYKYKRKKDIIK